MPLHELTVPNSAFTPDVNDKLTMIDELTQEMDNDGTINPAGLRGTQASDLDNGVTGSGLIVLQSSPSITTPTISGGTLTSPTIVTPTIASFTNAQHNHTNAAGGGQLTTAVLSDYTSWTTYTPTRTAATGTWTAGTVAARYRKIGKSVLIQASFESTSLSAGTATISFTLPSGMTVSASAVQLRSPIGQIINNAAVTSGFANVAASATTIVCYNDPAGSGWALSVTSTTLYVNVEIEIV